MRRVLLLREEAEHDIIETTDFYHARSAAAGERFRSNVIECFSRIAAYPLSYALASETMRAAPVRGYPYRIMYEVHPSEIQVVGVMHHRRCPRSWPHGSGTPER